MCERASFNDLTDQGLSLAHVQLLIFGGVLFLMQLQSA